MAIALLNASESLDDFCHASYWQWMDQMWSLWMVVPLKMSKQKLSQAMKQGPVDLAAKNLCLQVIQRETSLLLVILYTHAFAVTAICDIQTSIQ